MYRSSFFIRPQSVHSSLLSNHEEWKFLIACIGFEFQFSNVIWKYEFNTTRKEVKKWRIWLKTPGVKAAYWGRQTPPERSRRENYYLQEGARVAVTLPPCPPVKYATEVKWHKENQMGQACWMLDFKDRYIWHLENKMRQLNVMEIMTCPCTSKYTVMSLNPRNIGIYDSVCKIVQPLVTFFMGDENSGLISHLWKNRNFEEFW